MTKHILVVFLVAACGGSSTKATTPTPDPVPMTDPATPAEPTAGAPAEPSQPTPPPEPPQPDPKVELMAAETAAYEKAKPVFAKSCSGCHQKGAKNASEKKLKGFDMTAYPFGGEHAKEIGKEIRKVLAIGGGKPSMPKGKAGSVKGDDLALIAAWADAFDASHAGGAHAGH